MRASLPSTDGTIDRAGVEIFYEVHGGGDQTLLLIPPAPITHSKIFKAQVPYLARHFRVLTFDGRGNGRAGRPSEPEAHARGENVADIIAVMDATETDRATLVAHCHANWWAVELAAQYPERVTGLVAIDPGVPCLGRPQPHWVETAPHWDEILDDPQGWELNNKQVYLTEHRRWIEWFFSQPLVEPHSTKQFEDAVGWALESTGKVLAAGEEGAELDPPSREEFEDLVAEIDYPVLVIHGDLDACQHIETGEDLAAATGGELAKLEGAGHLTLARDPVTVNHTIKRFVDRLGERPWKATFG